MRILKNSVISCILILCACSCFAQDNIFPDLTGNVLMDSLRTAFKPATVMTSSEAKDTLYSILNNENDTVRCVYSGHYLILPENVDPSQWVFMNGETQGINLEHVYPQSKGATTGTQAHNNLHHLFPTRVKVNSDRGSFPFGEINDFQTQRWYYLTNVTGSIPSSNIDLYSEWNNAFFEPREDFKGDVARAVFYFFTIYQNQALVADPAFFEIQRQTLLDWHELDPATDDEVLRSDLVATFQDGKINPFVVDPTLASRAFCMGGEDCMTTGISTLDRDSRDFRAFNSGSNIQIDCNESIYEVVEVRIYDMMGRLLQENKLSLSGVGRYPIKFTDSLPGFYAMHIAGKDWQWSGILAH
jgi:endonuclease I